MSKALENTRKNFKRNYGIDLFRIVAMFMIVNLHVLKHGGARTGFWNSIYSNVVY